MDSVISVSVILPAAGTSERYNSSIGTSYCSNNSSSSDSSSTEPVTSAPRRLKQFESIHGKPVILHTLDRFLSVSAEERGIDVVEVIVSVSADQMDHMRSLLADAGRYARVRVVVGGASRHMSISSALHHISQSPPRHPHVVVVHDAVRPVFDPHRDLVPVCRAAAGHGAAGLVRPLVSTVLRPDPGGMLAETLPRERYVASEMPQGFLRHLIQSAYSKISEHDMMHGTECLEIVRKYENVRAKLVPGSEDLFKITYKKDLVLASHCLPPQAPSSEVSRNDIMSVLIVSELTICSETIKEMLHQQDPHAVITCHRTSALAHHHQRCSHLITIASDETTNLNTIEMMLKSDIQAHIVNIAVLQTPTTGEKESDISRHRHIARRLMKQNGHYYYAIYIRRAIHCNDMVKSSTYQTLPRRFTNILIKVLDDDDGVLSGQVLYVDDGDG